MKYVYYRTNLIRCVVKAKDSDKKAGEDLNQLFHIHTLHWCNLVSMNSYTLINIYHFDNFVLTKVDA
jgi:hypothetical protein